MKKILSLLVAVFLLVSPAVSLAKLSPGDFIDIRGHWAEQEIQTAYQAGIMSGTGLTTQGFKVFAPDGTVSRAQLAVVLERTLKLDNGKIRFIKAPEVSDYYEDVDQQSWYAGAVLVGAINHIFDQRYEFRPEEAVSRIEIARTINRAFQAKEIQVPMIMMMPQYEDTRELGTEDMNAMIFVSNTGIMKGSDQLFRPNNFLSRAEIATVMNRCSSLIQQNQSITEKTSVKMTTKSIKSESDLISIDLSIPEITGLKDKQIETIINERLETEAIEQKVALTAEATEAQKEALSSEYEYRSYSLWSDCKSYYENGKILSLYVDYYTYTGGAHGMTVRRAYNFDLTTGKELSLKDLFAEGNSYQDRINTAIQQEIDTRPDDFFSDDMGFQGISDEQGFYLQNGYLIVYFQLYDIACYAAGIQEFKIPY